MTIPPPNIDAMRDVCKLAKKLLDYITPFVKEGISTIELNDLCHNYTVKELNAESAPLNYKGFPKSICTSINNVICHGIPSNYKLSNGDILNIDVTVKKLYNGVYHYGDTSRMYLIGNVKQRHRKLCEVAKLCLDEAIKVVRNNQLLSTIGETVENIANKHNFSSVRDFCGHGIGTIFHTDPKIYHYRNNDTTKMKTGMIFTIEPMINEYKPRSRLLNDGWTAVTMDNGYSAQYEHTILVTDTGCEVLTK